MRSYFAVATFLLLQGCARRYADLLLKPSDTDAWSSSLNHVELAKKVFSHAEYGKGVNAIVQTTSGFHFEGYAIFLEEEIRFTSASFKTVTHKAEAHYDKMHLEWIVSELEARDVCSEAPPTVFDSGNGDYLVYRTVNGLRFCFEDGGYWNTNNQLHTWFWSTYQSLLKYTYSRE